MSENRSCNPVTRPNKSGKRLSRCEEGDDQTCPIQESDMSQTCLVKLTGTRQRTRISLEDCKILSDPDKSRLGAGHV
jgi:hypothetical protein